MTASSEGQGNRTEVIDDKAGQRRVLAVVLIGLFLSACIVAVVEVDIGATQTYWSTLLSTEQLPEEVQNCIRICVHVNLMVATSLHGGHPSSGASCASCSDLRPVSFEHRSDEDSRRLRLVDDAWRSVHRQELCKAVADDDDLHRQCIHANVWGRNKPSDKSVVSSGDTLGPGADIMARWAQGSSPLRECIASAQDFEDAQKCMSEDTLEERKRQPSPESQRQGDGIFTPHMSFSSYDKVVLRKCRGLENDKKLLHDCLDVEEGMRRALLPFGNHAHAQYSLEREPLTAQQRHKHHSGYEDARAAAREARRLRITESQQRAKALQTAQEHARTSRDRESNGWGEERKIRETRGRSSTWAPLSFSRSPGGGAPAIAPQARASPARPATPAPAPPRVTSGGDAVPNTAAVSATMDAIASLSKSVAGLEHLVAQVAHKQQDASSARPLINVAPIIKVAPVINFNVSSLEHAVSYAPPINRSEEGAAQHGSNSNEDTLLEMLNRTISLLSSEHQSGSLQPSGTDLMDLILKLDKKVSGMEGKLDSGLQAAEEARQGRDTGAQQHSAGVGQTDTDGVEEEGKVEAHIDAPLIEPAGGSFKQPVIVTLSCQTPAQLFFTLDGSVPTTNSSAYIGKFVLLPGSTVVVRALAVSEAGAVHSNVTSATFQIEACTMHSKQCCDWMVAYARLQALRDSLADRNASLVSGEEARSLQARDREQQWLESEVGYNEAEEQGKEEEEAVKYAMRMSEVWGQASKVSLRRYKVIVAENAVEREELDQERALIRDIIAMLTDLESGAQTKGAAARQAAMAKLAEIQTRVKGLPDGAVDGGALKSLVTSLVDMRESSEVRGLLEDMLKDLDARTALLSKIEEKALTSADQNEVKLRQWQKQAVHYERLASEARAQMVQQELRKEILGGSVKADGELSWQAADESNKAKSYAHELRALEAIISKTREAVDTCNAP